MDADLLAEYRALPFWERVKIKASVTWEFRWVLVWLGWGLAALVMLLTLIFRDQPMYESAAWMALALASLHEVEAELKKLAP